MESVLEKQVRLLKAYVVLATLVGVVVVRIRVASVVTDSLGRASIVFLDTTGRAIRTITP